MDRKVIVVDIVLILLIGLLPLTWFRSNSLISSGWDFDFPLNRSQDLNREFFAWDNMFSLGQYNPRILAGAVPYGAILGFTQDVGISLLNSEKFMFFFWFAFSGLSMYFLCRTLIKGRGARLAALSSALFYMLNPFSLIFLWSQLTSEIFLYTFIPLMLALYIKGITEHRGMRYAFIVALIQVVTTCTAFVNPVFFVICWLVLLSYFIFQCITVPKLPEIKAAAKFTFFLLLFSALVNIFWIIPALTSIQGSFQAVGLDQAGLSDLSLFKQNSASIIGTLRLSGYWSLNQGYKGDPYFSWGSVFSSPFLVALSFLIPIIVFIPLLKRRKDKSVLYFSLMAILALVGISWIYMVPNWFSLSILNSVPILLRMFREPYQKIGIILILSFAFLFGKGISDLNESLKGFKGFFKKAGHFFAKKLFRITLVGSILVLILGVYAFPFWTGDIIYPGGQVIPSARFVVPSYYNDANNWIKSQNQEFVMLPLPFPTLYSSAYNWSTGYWGTDPSLWLFSEPTLSRYTADNGYAIATQIAEQIANMSSNDVAKVLALLNVKYILLHGDTNWNYVTGLPWWVSTSMQDFQNSLGQQNGFYLEKTFGELYFYRNAYWQPNLLTAQSDAVLVDGGIAQLINSVETSDFNFNDSVVLLSNQLSAQQISALPANTEIVQNHDSSGIYTPVSVLQNDSKNSLIYMLSRQPIVTARYYSGWKGIVSTNGNGEPGMMIFSSPDSCPYLSAFPDNLTEWNSYNSTLIYITTSSPLTIDSITADGASVGATAWWQTGTSWTTGWPITIPSNETAIIQVRQKASNIVLQTDTGPIAVTVTDGWTNPISAETSNESMIKVFTPNTGNYSLSIDSAKGFEYRDLSVKIDNQAFIAKLNLHNLTYSVGPFFLIAGSHTITISDGNIIAQQINNIVLQSLSNGESSVNIDDLFSSSQLDGASINYYEVNPTQYNIQVNASVPFYLSFGQSYNSGWVAIINGQQIPAQYHFTTNGYANGWYINKTGTYTITLEFTPQNLFFDSAAISAITIIVCTIYFSKNKIKSISKNLKKKNYD